MAQVIPRGSLSQEKGRVDGVCILQTPRVCFETFPGEKQSRDPGPGNRGQAEDGSEEGAAPWEQDLRDSWASHGQQQGGGGGGHSCSVQATITN